MPVGTLTAHPRQRARASTATTHTIAPSLTHVPANRYGIGHNGTSLLCYLGLWTLVVRVMGVKRPIPIQ